MSRNIGIDALKVLACLGVVILHVSGLSATNSNSFVFEDLYYYLATFSIPIFFSVNGYLLLGKKNINYPYVFKKIFNILRIVIVWNVAIFLLHLFSGELTNPLKTTVGSLVQKGYFFQFWFFGTLIIIYLVLPVLFKWFNKLCILMLSISIIITLLIDVISIISNFPIQSLVIQTFRIWTWLTYFMLGGIIKRRGIHDYITNKISLPVHLLITILLLLTSIGYEIYIAHNIYNFPWAEYFYDNIFIMLIVLFIFTLFLRINFTEKSKKVVEFVSPNIMGIYIIHITFLRIYTHLVNFNSVMLNILLLIIVFLSSLIFTVLVRMTKCGRLTVEY